MFSLLSLVCILSRQLHYLDLMSRYEISFDIAL